MVVPYECCVQIESLILWSHSHQGESSDGEVDASGLSREIDSFLTLLAEKESNWQGESGENGQ